MSDYAPVPESARQALLRGLAIPAHPLALTLNRRLDERRQKALTRYYHAAGAGGLAVGVHTTQFEIRAPHHNLLHPILSLAADTIQQCDQESGRKTVLIAGVCGRTDQALKEAKLARDCGYHAGLLSLADFKEADDDQLVDHCRTIAEEIALFGFYLQPAAGGRALSESFWRRFLEIPNVIGIKIAPFNRYRTLDVLRALAETGRENEIALYTGNDDNILIDLLTPFSISGNGSVKSLHFAGGLLGHWACWTRRAVDLFESCKAARSAGFIPANLLTQAAQVTDCNAAFFDAQNEFSGCIPGIHEVLRRQGLLENTTCLSPDLQLSSGQAEQIDRVYKAYPHLNDDSFVRENLDRWLK